jgi:DNA-binding NtrC family response regulator
MNEAALKWLQGLNRPGNVRELKHLIERTVLMTDADVIEVDDFALPSDVVSRGQ